MEFEDKNAAMIYALRIQGAGRKGDTELEKAYRIGKQYILMRQSHGGQTPGSAHGGSAQNEHSNTSEIIASRLGIGQATVRRHADFAEAIDLIKSKVDGGQGTLWKAILREDLVVKREDLSKLAKLLKKNDLYYLPPDTEDELKEQLKKMEEEEKAHAKSGEPNVPPVMTNLLNMKVLASDVVDAVFCPFCGKKGGDKLKVTWLKCGLSIEESVVKANENLEQFSAEAKARVDAREAAEKARKLKKLISVDVIASNMLKEAYVKEVYWDKDTIPGILYQIDNLNVKPRGDFK